MVNTSLINRLPSATDVTVVPVAANEIAKEAGSAKAANMVVLGAYAGRDGRRAGRGASSGVLAEAFPATRQKFVALNQQRSARGFEIGQGHTAVAAR